MRERSTAAPAAARAERAETRICILASMGWGVRNVLMSRAMDAILEESEVHLLTTFDHVEDFRERFAHMDSQSELPLLRWSNLAKIVFNLNMLMYYRLSPSRTHAHKLRQFHDKYRMGKIITWRERIKRFLVAQAGTYVAHPTLVRLTQRLLWRWLRRKDQYRHARRILEEKGITAVVSSNPLNEIEAPALLAAQDLGIKTIAIITSWDNLSSKNPYIIDFDAYLVWSPIMADEVVRYCDAADAEIEEIGPLQFDYYFDENFFETRESFCQRYGFDPERKIVVHSLVTQGLMPDEGKLIEELLLALKAGRVKGDPNFLLRLHPKRDIAEFEWLIGDPRFKDMRVAWTVAGNPVRDKNDRWCPMDDEVSLLTNTVRHGDVNLNVFSTMLIDFAVLDRPAVLISHDADDNPKKWDQYEHLDPIFEAKGQRITFSFQETLDALNTYLENPSLEAEGRKRIVDIECGQHVGRAWERLAVVLPRVAAGEAAPEGNA